MPQDKAKIGANWTELRRHLGGMPPGASANAFLFYHAKLARTPDDVVILGPNYYGAAEALTRGALMERVDVVEALMPQVTGRARAIAESRAAEYDQLSAANLAAVAVLTLEEACGLGDAAAHVERPLARLERDERLDEAALRQTVWALLAFGRTDALAGLLYRDPGAERPDSSATFEANEHRVQLHFARCMRQGAGTEVATPAWRGYLGYFPLNLSTSTATWPELLWAARTYRVVIGGGAPGELVEWLRGEIGRAR